MNKKRQAAAGVVVIFFFAGCAQQSAQITPADSPELPERGFLMGMLPIPEEGQSLEEAYSAVSEYCEFVPVWGRPPPFYQLAEDLSGSWGKTFVDDLIRSNGMIPLIHMSFIDVNVTLKTPPGMEASLSNPEWRDLYKKAALDIVTTAEPLYLSLGNEVNRWYEKYGVAGSNGFQHYITLYEDIYDAVKEISPQTKVFCTFSREIVAENREADLDVLQLFDPQKMDILVLTSYPFAVKTITIPDDIPDNYYYRAAHYMPGKPVGFSEVAWSSADAFGGEQGQADFLLQLCERLTSAQGIDLHFVGWPWQRDLDNDTTGLMRRDGTEKVALTVWKALFTGGSIPPLSMALFSPDVNSSRRVLSVYHFKRLK